MMKNKGQISLEYLATYSWAIVILLTIVAALSYYGFFSEKSFVKTECDSGPFLSCEDSTIQVLSGGDIIVKLKLRNNMNDNIKIEEVEIIEYSKIFPINSDSLIARGELWTSPDFQLSADIEEGDIEELSFQIKYYRDESGAPKHFINGGLKAIVVEE